MMDELFQRLKSHNATFPSGNQVSTSDIEKIECEMNIKLPENYKRFLVEFGDEGEFVFGRGRSLDDDDMIEAFWHYRGPHLGENARAKYFPFADDYSGNYYCFELKKMSGSDCPVICVDHAVQDSPEQIERFSSFKELLTMALDGLGSFK